MVGVTGNFGSGTPSPVESLLGAAVPQFAERLLEARIRREWRDLVGHQIARRCLPGELRSGTLTLIVDNSPWLQELALREPELLNRLASRYGPDTVRSLRPTLGALPPEPVARLPERAVRSKRRPTAEEMRMIDAAVTLIADRELRDSARRLLAKACVAWAPADRP